MNFGLFYDSGPQSPGCNVNPPTDPYPNQPTGQMFGGYLRQPGSRWLSQWCLYSDPRIAIYIGMGLHQMPGDVWWRSWRVLPPKQCATDPDFSWLGQWPAQGYWQTYTDFQSRKTFNVWEGHYDYPGTSTTFVPTWAGGMFEGLMANLVMPETTFGPRSFGLNDLRWAQVQVQYATQALHYPVWGMSPSSTAGRQPAPTVGSVSRVCSFPTSDLEQASTNPSQGLSQCWACATEDTVSPHASFLALSVLPQEAYTNIVNLRTIFPEVYASDGGFYDAVNPIHWLDRSSTVGARPIHDHGRRSTTPSIAGPMQRHFFSEPRLSGWIALSCPGKDVDQLAEPGALTTGPL